MGNRDSFRKIAAVGHWLLTAVAAMPRLDVYESSRAEPDLSRATPEKLTTDIL
jgi:hypothetical protein